MESGLFSAIVSDSRFSELEVWVFNIVPKNLTFLLLLTSSYVAKVIVIPEKCSKCVAMVHMPHPSPRPSPPSPTLPVLPTSPPGH